MKKIAAIIIIALCVIKGNHSFSQIRELTKQSIPSQPLEISLVKTTNLIFPYSIRSVDLGSSQVIAQQATGVENILQLKAAIWGFDQTNLSVITGDGKLYSFTLDYSDSPAVLNLQLPVDVEVFNHTLAVFDKSSGNEARIWHDIRNVQTMQPIFKNMKGESGGVQMAVDGIYIHDNLLYFQIRLVNNSNISYDIDQLRFYIRDQKKSKRTAEQETTITAEQSLGNTSKIYGKSSQVIVVAVSKFTIPDKKYLGIQLLESNGGRHIEIHIKNKKLIKAVTFN